MANHLRLTLLNGPEKGNDWKTTKRNCKIIQRRVEGGGQPAPSAQAAGEIIGGEAAAVVEPSAAPAAALSSRDLALSRFPELALSGFAPRSPEATDVG